MFEFDSKIGMYIYFIFFNFNLLFFQPVQDNYNKTFITITVNLTDWFYFFAVEIKFRNYFFLRK